MAFFNKDRVMLAIAATAAAALTAAALVASNASAAQAGAKAPGVRDTSREFSGNAAGHQQPSS
ncbi:MAG TPA: hypothetical protein VG942_14075 [Hyphomonadaceae bacterium]|nr:hypothetical protein [Hyphomonadaceae bacterium]